MHAHILSHGAHCYKKYLNRKARWNCMQLCTRYVVMICIQCCNLISDTAGPTVHNLRLADVTRVQPSGPPGLQSKPQRPSFSEKKVLKIFHFSLCGCVMMAIVIQGLPKENAVIGGRSQTVYDHQAEGLFLLSLAYVSGQVELFIFVCPHPNSVAACLSLSSLLLLLQNF